MNDVYRIDDSVYNIGPHLNVGINTVLVNTVDGKDAAAHKEFITGRKKGQFNVLVKRDIKSYLSFNFKNNDGAKTSLWIGYDLYYELLAKLDYICKVWLADNSDKVFIMLNNNLKALDNTPHVIIRCACDKYIDISPTVLNTVNGAYKALIFATQEFQECCLGDKVKALYGLLCNFDILTYSNVAISGITGYQQPINRIDLKASSKPTSVIEEEDNNKKFAPRKYWSEGGKII